MDAARPVERTFSLEMSPPKTADAASRWEGQLQRLQKLRPQYLSVTSGAGGTEHDGTYAAVERIRHESDIPVAPHVTCIGASRESMRTLLGAYLELGVRRVVALRGDRPTSDARAGEFRYASELVTFIRCETGHRFHIEVAAYPEFHPEAESAQSDLEHFKGKADAGADSAITQYFYNGDAYFRLVESCDALGVHVPIVPGIMPITNHERLVRFSDAMGVEIPRWLRRRLEGYGADVDSLRAFGVDVVTRLCRTLLDGGAPGLHFYTMNNAEPTVTIWRNLGLAVVP